MAGPEGQRRFFTRGALVIGAIFFGVWALSGVRILRVLGPNDTEASIGCGCMGLRWGYINLWCFAPYETKFGAHASFERLPAQLKNRLRFGLICPDAWGFGDRYGVVNLPMWLVGACLLLIKVQRLAALRSEPAGIRLGRKVLKWSGLMLTALLAAAWYTGLPWLDVGQIAMGSGPFGGRPSPAHIAYVDTGSFIVSADEMRPGSLVALTSGAPHSLPSIHTTPSGGFAAALTPLWFPAASALVLTVIFWWRDRRRIPPGHCHKCGYNLTGNISGVCSECGTRIKANPVGAPATK